ncbi:MAG: DUF4129 domain-containing protein [Treponema sp.]|jgi:hypothetical protein|nr:DUF4129 domain-containing protein [Treponema sp.]
MKSSEEISDFIQTDSQNILTIQHPLYALLAVYIPLSIFAGLLPSLNFLASLFIGPAPVFLWFCSGLLSGTIASIYWAIIKRSKADHTAANIRGGILVVIVIYVFGSLIRSGLPLGRRFIPSFTNFFSSLFSVVIWFTVLASKRIFEGQELIASYTRIYDGEKLRQIMLQDSGIMSEVDTDTKKLITRYRVFFLLPFVLIIVCGILGMPLSATFATALTLLFSAGVSIIAFLGFLRREYAYAAEGLVFTSRPKALLAGIIVIFASAVLGLLLSSGKSILSFDIILNLLRRLLAYLDGLFTGKPPVEMPPRSEEALTPQMPGLPPEFAAMIAEAKPSHFWDYVQYAAIGLVVFLFVSFMINPLLNRSKLFRGAGTWPKKIAAFLKAWFKALASGLKGFFSSLRESAGGRRLPDSAILRSIEENILEGYTAAKKRDMRRSAGLFARLIYWGTEVLRINWRPNHAPLEYCALLVAAVNGDSANNDGIVHAITRAGALFDKALYSAEPLTRPERDEFKALVEMVTESRI